ncbi:hypothetical protein TRFO_31164 [Tritrichomonas foetus]|uniref:Uncharacterized protein n=1 Tax=Tritrichomonas foetus TaxID=1144522 RepID=A0A1J4JTX8_9EUKA|nr:hypothetical protein TRFO_31164 [Tritrichomonas foetus]|eukprot:OHT01920.1 hypothetical protein TRFO_31164 [Tritrichomonas foetus]
MAQVLQAKKDFDKAIDKFLLVCECTERVIAMNPGANVEIHWVVFSLGAISDIYQDRQDYNKSILYRNAQRAFLEFMQTQKGTNKSTFATNSDSDDEDLITIATKSHSYMKLFESVHEAMKAPEKPPPEDPQELMRKLQEARKKDEEEKIEQTIKLLNEAADAREKEIQNSFWKRNMQRITDHPVIFVFIVLIISVCVILFVKFKPKKKINIPGGIDAQMAYLEQYVRDYERKHGKKEPKKPVMHGHHHHHHHHDL